MGAFNFICAAPLSMCAACSLFPDLSALGGAPPPGDASDVARCGDGFIDPGEECDDGANASSDGCSPTCKVECSGADEYEMYSTQHCYKLTVGELSGWASARQGC